VRGVIPSLPQCAFTVWCSVKAQGQLYLLLLPLYTSVYQISVCLRKSVRQFPYPVSSTVDKLAVMSLAFLFHIVEFPGSSRRPQIDHSNFFMFYLSPYSEFRVMAYIHCYRFLPNTFKLIIHNYSIIPLSYPCALTKHHGMKAYWGSGSIAPRILDFGTR
jgi:hypothetical protein